MLSDYLPVLFQILLAVGFAAISLVLSVVLGKKGQADGVKNEAYECGMLPVGDGTPRFSVKFYLVAMLFVIFDIEAVFSYVWAVSFSDLIQESANVLWSMLLFFGVLTLAYIYALKKGALSWKS
ncbi:MAG: NADH-quinone oxidoreductase subunit A [Verrucomicrobiota bacterium JB023]|nr:NADH-quinone oxidoreductase subunit A [Verrucomicrobiota bacterium JB023]